MNYVLDTKVLAALMRGDERVVARLERAHRARVGVPEPAWAEIAYGLSRMPPSKRRERLKERLGLLRAELTTVPWTEAVSERFGEVKALLERRGARLEDLDLAMAAHALALEATLVTANLKHLARGEALRVEDWG